MNQDYIIKESKGVVKKIYRYFELDGKKYIIYTTGEKDNNGNVIKFTAEVSEENNKISIENIVDEKEMQFVQSKLEDGNVIDLMSQEENSKIENNEQEYTVSNPIRNNYDRERALKLQQLVAERPDAIKYTSAVDIDGNVITKVSIDESALARDLKYIDINEDFILQNKNTDVQTSEAADSDNVDDIISDIYGIIGEYKTGKAKSPTELLYDATNNHQQAASNSLSETTVVNPESMQNGKRQVDNAITSLEGVSTSLDGIDVPYKVDVMYQISLAIKNIKLVEEKILDLSYKLGKNIIDSLEIDSIDDLLKYGFTLEQYTDYITEYGTEEDLDNLLTLIKTSEEEAKQLKSPTENTGAQEEEIPWWIKFANFVVGAQNLNAESTRQMNEYATASATQGGLLFAEGTVKTGENIVEAFDFAKLKASLTDERLLFLYQDLNSLQLEMGLSEEKQAFNDKVTFNATDMQEVMEQYFLYLGIDDTSMFFKDRTPEEEEEFRNSTASGMTFDDMSYDEIETVLLNFMYNNSYNIDENNDPVKNLDNRPMERYQLEQSFTRPVEINGMTPDEYLSANLGNLVNLPTGPLSVLEYNGNFQERMLNTINPNGILTSKERSDYAILGYYLAAKEGQSFAESIGLSNETMRIIFSGNHDILDSQPNFNEDSTYYDLTYREIGNNMLNALKNSDGEVFGVNVNRREKGTTKKSGSTMISDKNIPLFVEAMEDISKDKTGAWFDQKIYQEAVPFNVNMTWKEYLDENSLIHKDNLGGQVMYGIGAMMPSILANAIPVIGPYLSTTVLATSSYGGNVEENLNLVNEYNPDLMEVDPGDVYNRVNQTSTLQASVTVALEKLMDPALEGFKVGDSKGLLSFLDDWIEKIPSGATKKAVNTLKSMVTEAVFEELPDWYINTQVAANVLLPENKDEVLNDFITPEAAWNTITVTMLTAGILSSVHLSNMNEEQKDALQFTKDVYESQPENVRKMVSEAEEIMGDAYRTSGINGVVQNLAEKISKFFNIQAAKSETNVATENNSKTVGIDLSKIKLVIENFINKVQSVVIVSDDEKINDLEKNVFDEQAYNSLSNEDKKKYVLENMEQLLQEAKNGNFEVLKLANAKLAIEFWKNRTAEELKKPYESSSSLLQWVFDNKLIRPYDIVETAITDLEIAQICIDNGNFGFLREISTDMFKQLDLSKTDQNGKSALLFAIELGYIPDFIVPKNKPLVYTRLKSRSSLQSVLNSGIVTPQYAQIINKYFPKMSYPKMSKLLKRVNARGACSYSAIVDVIYNIYGNMKNGEKLFQKDFGYEMYNTKDDGSVVLNEGALLLDLFCWFNKDNGVVNFNGLWYDINPEEKSPQRGVTSNSYFDIYGFLKSKMPNTNFNLNYFTTYVTNQNQSQSEFLNQICAIFSNNAHVIIRINNREKNFPIHYYEARTNTVVTMDSDGHDTYIHSIDVENDRIYICSWGRSFYIKISELYNFINNDGVLNFNAMDIEFDSD